MTTRTNTKQKKFTINLRISEETYDKLKDRAKKNGATLSDLVRSSLNDSLDIATDIAHDVFGTEKDSKKHVLYYTKATADQDMTCSACTKTIKKKQSVFVGETKSGKRLHLCTSCHKKKS